ncbi:4Fe-4S dicluster domain-containing protein [Prauserella cavernicola]|uniref:Ferredoxin family protein n=1 Tax=Prauserella cavernicola TaxID=2800127 RepID=A0A934QXT6_9PSEU|nr:ferredoxin family protein [Prauserella cavernicola]MBK1787489.1 ferredoxin family protein [Prauserella cavernicola]
MIEIVSSARCVACDLCIKVCPTDVFERGADGIPVIARQDDCQTCFMCEVYCPTDALYVAPLGDPAPPDSPHTDEDALVQRGELGAYRAAVGWGRGRAPGASLDKNYLFTQDAPAREQR